MTAKEFGLRSAAGAVGAVVVAIVGLVVAKKIEDRNTAANRAKVKALLAKMPNQRHVVVEGRDVAEHVMREIQRRQRESGKSVTFP